MNIVVSGSKWTQRDMVFIKTSKRSITEQFVKDNYNGLYSIREV